MIDGWLDSAFSPVADDKKVKQEYLDALAKICKQNPYEMTLHIRAQYASAIINEILNRAELQNLYEVNSKRNKAVEENSFKVEIDALIHIMISLKLSDAFLIWVNNLAFQLSEQIETLFPYEKTKKSWPTLSLQEQKNLIKEVLAMQAQLFSEHGLNFEPANIKFKEHKLNTTCGWTNITPITNTKYELPEIFINEKLAEQKDSYDLILITAVHEGMHVIFHQLARMYFEGLTPKDHPFKQDIETLYEIKTAGAHGTTLIPSSYICDPEERVIKCAHEQFAYSYTGSSSQLRYGNKSAQNKNEPSP